MPILRFALLSAAFSFLLSSAGSVAAATVPVAPPAHVMQLAELTPSTRAGNDWFGFSIAISGNTVVVGAFDANTEQYGTVYVYVKPGTGWANMTQVATLTSSDDGQGFGTSVAISGNTIVVGAADTSNFDPRAPQAAGPGAAYVFVEPAGGWSGNLTESAKLTASDGQDGDAFGDSVSIAGASIAVGAFFAVDSSGNGFAGKAYVFVKPTAGWSGTLTQTAELTASDSELLNYLGVSMGISGDTVIAGAQGHNNFQGAGYVFVESADGWTNMTQTAELTASDGRGSADLGFASAISGNTIVEGAPGAASAKGAAYLYVKPAGGWVSATQTAELRAPSATADDSFGQSAGISGKAISIGAPNATVAANGGQGAAYVFLEPSGGWQNTSHADELTASDGAANDGFGLSIGISGSTIVSGAINANNLPGSAYVFGR